MTEPTVNEAAIEDTETSLEQNQVEKTFTQDEVNKLITQRVDRERNKYDKKYGSIDVEHYEKLIAQEEKKALNEKKARGEFDSILKETVTKKDAVISNLEQELRNIKVNGALLNEASARKAISPEQVVRLLGDRVKLNAEDGQVEVLDDTGKPRYTEAGDLMGVHELVGEFLQSNPHFVQAGPKGAGTSNAMSAQQPVSNGFDLEALDMNNPEDRAKYKEARVRGLI